ncbi:alpha-xylosidase [Capsulimonas corticalis]|uniref:Alpha-xylosidase n=1 Tax=Capsulimonas corticalis TaxID=2219043 RepID=A0A402CUA5_9BACT|nr:TIM-barrel domain-containing protein [Capsulimonas corticalis]BDI28933.1 alpha-xylosidase [Capsulimonas corticalis]
MLLKPSGSFLSFDSGPLQARIYQATGHIELAGPDLAGNPLANVITYAPPSITVPGGAINLGQVQSSTALADGLEVVQSAGASNITAHLTFPHDGVMRYEVVDWRGLAPTQVTLTAFSDAGEHFYGFGEKFNAFDQSGDTVDILTFDNPGNKGDHSYKVSPWFVSTRGYGFHWDSSAESRFDMRAGAADRYVITSRFPQLQFNVVYGPKLTDVLTRYTGYAGRPPLSPPWSFGVWISSDIWRSGGEVRYAVTKFRQQNIPVSGFVFDSPWEVAYNDFTFNQAQFAQGGTFEGVNFAGFATTKEMLEFLRSEGLKVICWMTPLVNTSSDSDGVPGQNLGKAANYDEGANNNFFVRSAPGGPPLVVPWWKGHGSPVDFTNPAAAKWLSDQLHALVTSSETVTASGGSEPVIGGFKTDDGESGNGANTYIPATAAYADGRRGVEMQNGYCVEYHKTIGSVLGANGVLFARSGFTGSQAFPGCWAGDNEPNFGDGNGLPSVIVAGQSAAMSGFSIWGHDVGGYQNTNFSPVSPPQLFMRWTQFGCFTPLMQMHRQVNPADLRQYPWGYGAPALENYRFFASLHLQLFPYLYTYAKESSDTGLPIIRPLVLLHQDDPQTFPVKHTYCFGNELLVAPVIQPTPAGQPTTRSLYLPEGQWRDFWTQEQHAGQQTIAWTSGNPQQFPLFVREGAIVPMLLNVPQTLCDANYVNNPAIQTMDAGLQFLVYPSDAAPASSFTLYEGTEVTCQGNSGAPILTLTSNTPRPVVWKILGAAPANGVTRDGAALNEQALAAAFDAATEGWRHDAGFTFVKFNHAGGFTRIAL